LNPESWRTAKQVEQNYFREIYEALLRFLSPEAQPENVARPVGREEFLEGYAQQAATRMVLGVRRQQERTWRVAAQKAMRGQEFYRALQQELTGPVGARMSQLIQYNSRLISSLPPRIRGLAAREAARRTGEGERATPTADLLRYVVRSRAALIARTETSKATTALTQARSEDLGVQWYVWETSRDQRVRLSHRKMQGVLVSWADPPSPEQLFHEKFAGYYAAGNVFSCRCYPAPLLRWEQVAWPHKVYLQGRVQYMTLAGFKRINNSVALAA
jgi:SPP1 gp7 family putative phage head morphogenesis protein